MSARLQACAGGLALLLALSALGARAQEPQQRFNVSGRLQLRGPGKPAQSPAVVWLEPVGETRERVAAWRQSPATPPPRLTQRNKQFDPHLLVVPVGGVVVFPNHDPFFHNVFSLFEGQRFDLGLYEAGSTREVHFDKPGISYIFCNIHSEMSAVVIALANPYYAIPAQTGELVIRDVPAGAYNLKVWAERASPRQLTSPGIITVNEQSRSLGLLQLTVARTILSHKNKYGLDYDPPTPDNPAYVQR